MATQFDIVLRENGTNPFNVKLTDSPAWAANNLLTVPSEEFNNTGWLKIETTVVANLAISPAGINTADALLESSANADHIIVSHPTGISVNAGGLYTVSVYAAPDTRDSLLLAVFNSALTSVAFIAANLTVGVIGSPTPTGTFTAANNGIITTEANGYKRISFQFTTSETTVKPAVYLLKDGLISYQGDGASGLLIWGMQVNDLGLSTYQKVNGTEVDPTLYSYSSSGTILKVAGSASATKQMDYPVTGNLKVAGAGTTSRAFGYNYTGSGRINVIAPTSGTPGTPAFVQMVENSTSGSGSSIASGNFGASVTSGNKILVVCRSPNTVTHNAPTDTLGTTYTQIGSSTDHIGVRASQWVGTLTSSGTNSVTANFSGSGAVIAVAAIEISGTNGSDATCFSIATNGGGIGADVIVSGSATNTTASGELFGWAMDLQGPIDAAGTGFTSRATGWLFGGAQAQFIVESKSVTSIASQQATFADNQFDNHLAGMVLFVPSAGAAVLYTKGMDYPPTGTLSLGGSAATTKTMAYSPDGQIIRIAGLATTSNTSAAGANNYTYGGNGLIFVSCSQLTSQYGPTSLYFANGYVLLGGSASVTKNAAYNADGLTLKISGSATVTKSMVYVPDGLLLSVSGTSSITKSMNYASDGLILRISGAAITTQASSYAYNPAGTILIAGTSPQH
jgi:hypothetical protein